VGPSVKVFSDFSWYRMQHGMELGMEFGMELGIDLGWAELNRKR
jgi:hypothetical protein